MVETQVIQADGLCDGQDWKQTQQPGNKRYLKAGCQEEERELWGSEEG